MAERVLIVYASRTGTAAEVAEVVAEVLRERRLEVDVRSVDQVRGELTTYQAVVLGCSVRMSHLLPEMIGFVRKYREELSTKPIAYFAVGLTLREDTPENRAQMLRCLEPLRYIREPVSVGLFGGRMEYGRLSRFWRFYARWAQMPAGDYRNWQSIRAWAQEIALEFLGVQEAAPA